MHFDTPGCRLQRAGQVVNPDFIGTLPTELGSSAESLFGFSRISVAFLYPWPVIEFRNSPNRPNSRVPESVLSFLNRCIQDHYAVLCGGVGRQWNQCSSGLWIRSGGCRSKISWQRKGQDFLACNFLAPRDRLELPTKWLTATRSTNWATGDQSGNPVVNPDIIGTLPTELPRNLARFSTG